MIASAAVVVSVFSFGHAALIDYRIKKRDDRRAAFDAAVAYPFLAKLDLLEPILLEINVICSESDVALRASKLSELQRKEHASWYMVIAGFIEAQDFNSFASAHQATNEYWDKMSEHINDISEEADAASLVRLRKTANSLGQKYITKQRSEIHQRRALI